MGKSLWLPITQKVCFFVLCWQWGRSPRSKGERETKDNLEKDCRKKEARRAERAGMWPRPRHATGGWADVTEAIANAVEWMNYCSFFAKFPRITSVLLQSVSDVILQIQICNWTDVILGGFLQQQKNNTSSKPVLEN